MVLTDPMVRHTRRRVLAGAGALTATATLAGCGLFGDEEPEPAPAPDPLQPLLDEALALAAAYDRAVLAQAALSVRLTPIAGNHRAHAAALAQLIGAALPSGAAAPSASAVAPPSGSAAVVLARLRTAEQAGQKAAVQACRATTPERAALVGSIAAGRAAHADALGYR